MSELSGIGLKSSSGTYKGHLKLLSSDIEESTDGDSYKITPYDTFNENSILTAYTTTHNEENIKHISDAVLKDLYVEASER